MTGWSALGLGPFYGIPMKRFLEAVQPREDWNQLFQTSADGYTTGIDRQDLASSEAFFALYFEEKGKLIPPEHGVSAIFLRTSAPAPCRVETYKCRHERPNSLATCMRAPVE